MGRELQRNTSAGQQVVLTAACCCDSNSIHVMLTSVQCSRLTGKSNRLKHGFKVKEHNPDIRSGPQLIKRTLLRD